VVLLCQPAFGNDRYADQCGASSDGENIDEEPARPVTPPRLVDLSGSAQEVRAALLRTDAEIVDHVFARVDEEVSVDPRSFLSFGWTVG